MENRFEKLVPYVPLILRVGLALVFVFFGADKLMNVDLNISTFQLLPVPHMLPVATEVFLSAILELLVALLLLIGLWTRWVSFFAAVYIGLIVMLVGLSNVSRDVGLIAAALALGILGDGKWSVGNALSGSEQSSRSGKA